MLKSNNCRRLLVWKAVLDRAGKAFYSLREPGPAAIAVPCDLRPDGNVPVLVDCPIRRQLSGNPCRAHGVCNCDILRRTLKFKADGQRVTLPLHDRIREN